MWRRRSSENELHSRARLAIATCLSGGDPTDAWPAVWALAESTDRAAKDDVLAMLTQFIDGAVRSNGAGREALSFFNGEGSVTCRVANRWQKIEQACAFEAALLRSTPGSAKRRAFIADCPTSPSFDPDGQHAEALRRSGVQPGEGFPFWAMYMTRRSKRSWSF